MQLSRLTQIGLVTITVLLALNGTAAPVYKTTADINIRCGSGANFNSIGVALKGNQIDVVDSSNPNWFKIRYKTITGYVSRKYLVSEPVKVMPSPKKVQAIPQQTNQTRYLSSFGSILLIICLVLFFLGMLGRGKNKSQVSESKPVATKRTMPQPVASQKPTMSKAPQNTQLNTPPSPISNFTDSQKRNNVEIPNKNSTSNKEPGKQHPVEDVTGKSQPITYKNSPPVNTPSSAPYWRHQYVYSARELNTATSEQKAFYKKFKAEFLQNNWLDLVGNSNYAFILLFDLLDDYRTHHNLDLLENQYRFLWKNWPKTETYARDILIRQMGLAGDNQGINRLNAEKPSYQSNFNFQESYWGLGNRYKEKLKLNNDQVKILNALIDTSNSFNSIEFCAKQIIYSFFHVLDGLDKYFKAMGTSLEAEAQKIGELELTKHYKFKKGSNNYKSQLADFPRTIRQIVYKTCENSLRDFLSVGRKTDLSYYIHSKEATEQLNVFFSGILQELLAKYHAGMDQPDDPTEVELNLYSKGRWKVKLEALKTGFKSNESHQFYNSVLKLGMQNKANPSVENIFLDASKFIAKTDPVASLKLYVYYIYYDLLSATFDNRQLTKTIQKSLFKTPEQVNNFQTIINDFIKDKNVEKALEQVAIIYQTKRKKIKIDTTKVKEVQEQHAGTVDLLNEYLQDEEVPTTNTGSVEEIKIKVASTVEPSKKSLFKEELGLTIVQTDALVLLSKRGFAGSYEELDAFALENGCFRSSLIEGINENCYPVFDDILIEDADGAYHVNESYYQQILAS